MTGKLDSVLVSKRKEDIAEINKTVGHAQVSNSIDYGIATNEVLLYFISN